MLTISDNLVASLSRPAREEATVKLVDLLVEERPGLQQDPELVQRVADMVAWANDNGIDLEFDIQEMARLIFVHGVDVVADEDFKALLSDPADARRFIMLRYLETKPPRFWRTIR